MKNLFTALTLLLISITIHAQTLGDTIAKTDVPAKPLKLHHAEPLYVDLIRDLGARKGEHELNVGFGMNDEKEYVAYKGLPNMNLQ